MSDGHIPVKKKFFDVYPKLIDLFLFSQAYAKVQVSYILLIWQTSMSSTRCANFQQSFLDNKDL